MLIGHPARNSSHSSSLERSRPPVRPSNPDPTFSQFPYFFFKGRRRPWTERRILIFSAKNLGARKYASYRLRLRKVSEAGVSGNCEQFKHRAFVTLSMGWALLLGCLESFVNNGFGLGSKGSKDGWKVRVVLVLVLGLGARVCFHFARPSRRLNLIKFILYGEEVSVRARCRRVFVDRRMVPSWS